MNVIVRSPNVPAEYVGKARQFYREVEAEHGVVIAAFDRLCTPYFDRMKRYPRRNLREGEFRRFADAVEALPSRFRLEFLDQVDKRGRGGKFIDIRVQAAKMAAPDWAEDAAEQNLIIVVHMIQVPLPPGQRHASISLISIGLHALARRFQRGRDSSEAAILKDLSDLFLYCDHGLYQEGEEFRAPTQHGIWLGLVDQVDMVNSDRTHSHKQFLVRTFIEN